MRYRYWLIGIAVLGATTGLLCKRYPKKKETVEAKAKAYQKADTVYHQDVRYQSGEYVLTTWVEFDSTKRMVVHQDSLGNLIVLVNRNKYYGDHIYSSVTDGPEWAWMAGYRALYYNEIHGSAKYIYTEKTIEWAKACQSLQKSREYARKVEAAQKVIDDSIAFINKLTLIPCK